MSSTARSNDEWRKYDKNISKSVALEDLRDSVRQQDEEKVEKAIARCRDAGLQDNEKLKEATEIHLPVISARNRLREACKDLKENEDDEGVQNALKSIKRDELTAYLRLEVREAKNLLGRHEKSRKSKEKPKTTVSLTMDTKTVAEIRRYQNPAPVLHKVIQAALLLVGEDEGMTESWKNCQRICNPYGNNGLCRRVVSFDPSSAHPEIVARAKQILQEIKFDDVQAVGRSAPVTFYVWAMGSVEKSEAAAEKAEDKKDKQDGKAAKEATADSKPEKPAAAGGDKPSKKEEKKEEKEKVKPANRIRQKEILGRLPPAQDNQNFFNNNIPLNTKKKSKEKTDDHPAKSASEVKPSKPKTEEQTSGHIQAK